MSKTAKSVYYFGIYLLITSLNLLLAPNMLLDMLGLPPTEEVWIRVVGMVVFLIGIYYMSAGKNELWPFFKISLYTRPTVIIFFAIFVGMGWVGASLLLFGVADLLGAVWTYTAMKKEGKL